MAYDRHTLFAGALGVVIVAACIAGIAITGGPGEARKQKEDTARLQAVSTAAMALACYYQAHGDIPEDLAIVDAEMSHASSDARQQDYCSTVELRKDPFTGEDFRLIGENGAVTHICADFAASAPKGKAAFVPFPVAANNIAPDLDEPRASAGETCFELNLSGKLEY